MLENEKHFESRLSAHTKFNFCGLEDLDHLLHDRLRRQTIMLKINTGLEAHFEEQYVQKIFLV